MWQKEQKTNFQIVKNLCKMQQMGLFAMWVEKGNFLFLDITKSSQHHKSQQVFTRGSEVENREDKQWAGLMVTTRKTRQNQTKADTHHAFLQWQQGGNFHLVLKLECVKRLSHPWESSVFFAFSSSLASIVKMLILISMSLFGWRQLWSRGISWSKNSPITGPTTQERSDRFYANRKQRGSNIRHIF